MEISLASQVVAHMELCTVLSDLFSPVGAVSTRVKGEHQFPRQIVHLYRDAISTGMKLCGYVFRYVLLSLYGSIRPQLSNMAGLS